MVPVPWCATAAVSTSNNLSHNGWRPRDVQSAVGAQCVRFDGAATSRNLDGPLLPQRLSGVKAVEATLDTKPYITCRELIDFISAYRDNELVAEERHEFERHLGVCPSCVAYLSTYDTTVALAKRAGSEPAPADVPEALVQAILAARTAHG
jgi:hypothetical protein